MKKTIFTLNIDNYAPEICDITYPLIKRYARKIGADFHIIKERKFDKSLPPVIEKFQVYELSNGNDWSIYLDSDTLVHPETVDWTNFLNKDTVLFNGVDMGAVRWKYNELFLRDGRNIGACTWNVTWSDWCRDLWTFPEDPMKDIEENIFPTVFEKNTVVKDSHLIDDYTLSKNIARFGLKVDTIDQNIMTGDGLKIKVKLPQANFYWHQYTITIEEKVKQMKQVVEQWKV
ncbi:MAG TPA: hypothetical protein PKN54_00565 [Candidatus Cloacimonas acidaminovorans]|nr:hypothetical protein [Candidatus Cloacimonas acidaminovorans]